MTAVLLQKFLKKRYFILLQLVRVKLKLEIILKKIMFILFQVLFFYHSIVVWSIDERVLLFQKLVRQICSFSQKLSFFSKYFGNFVRLFKKTIVFFKIVFLTTFFNFSERSKSFVQSLKHGLKFFSFRVFILFFFSLLWRG